MALARPLGNIEMRPKKVRGHRRRWRDVQYWLDNGTELDLEHLKEYTYDYVKVRVHPWSSLWRHRTPKGKTKNLILTGLLDTYNKWEKALETLNQPYYLEIWLYDDRFEMSQVVCAIGDRIKFYEKTFHPCNSEKQPKFMDYGGLNNSLAQFDWTPKVHEYQMDLSDVGDPEDYDTIEEYQEELESFKKQIKKADRMEKLNEPRGKVSEVYFFKVSGLWTGGKK